ncbi:MAG TPA: LytTR family DNA-binding domain-containing protein [Puia sp.]|nr:LytTR family DNA-binding domain-containing protein [Puia sp.]
MQNNKKICCLVVDDEPPALDVLRKYIALIPSVTLAGTCNNAVEALHMLQAQNIDLLFLDIQMPQILGTDFVRTLKKPPKVIFTTAYRKFAVEGFELDAVDYLLKPISFERFLKAINKVMDVSLQNADGKEILAERHKGIADSFIHFRSNRKMLKIALDDILYIESLKDYIKVVTKTKTIITKQSISSLEENLPGNSFIRIHRSYIVALDKIESYTSELVEIAKQELPISRMYRHEVEKTLKS